MSLDGKEMFCRQSDERALIYYAMKDVSFYYAILSKLSPGDFLNDVHSTIMLIMSVLSTRNVGSFEPNNIISEAHAQGVLENIGGIKYMHALSRLNVSDSNFEHYLNEVVESTRKYSLYKILAFNIDHSREYAESSEVTSEDLIARVEGDILDLSLKNSHMGEPINLYVGLQELIDERRNKKVDTIGVQTGYPILDRQIDGMVPGTLQIIAARKKMGKSTLLTNIALHVGARLKKPVLYVDTEMSYGEWRDRAIACISGVKEREFKHGGYDDVAYERLCKAAQLVDKTKIFHEKMPGYSVDKLVALYKKYKIKEDIGLIVFDYLKEPDSSSVDRQRKEYQILGDVTTKLKDLAGILDIPALTAVQLNRSDDIADSDRIARYADVICHWMIRSKEEVDEAGKDAGLYKLVIKDSRRGGETNEHGIGFNFFKERAEIKEVPIEQQYFSQFDNVVNVDSASNYA